MISQAAADHSITNPSPDGTTVYESDVDPSWTVDGPSGCSATVKFGWEGSVSYETWSYSGRTESYTYTGSQSDGLSGNSPYSWGVVLEDQSGCGDSLFTSYSDYSFDTATQSGSISNGFPSGTVTDPNVGIGFDYTAEQSTDWLIERDLAINRTVPALARSQLGRAYGHPQNAVFSGIR